MPALPVIVAALLWTYFGWLILLGRRAAVFLRAEPPTDLRMGLTELRMSAVQREQLTLKIMFLIGRAYHDGKTRWTVDSLAHHLGMPGIAISRIVHALESARTSLTLTDDESAAAGARPRPDLHSGNHRHRAQRKAGQVGVAQSPIPAVDAISETMDEAWRKSAHTARREK